MKEFTPEQLVDVKKRLTRAYKDLQDICKQNNLRCFAAGGTAIGVVRHHGFIPWDDDIDVMMPRPDYIRLNELYDKEGLGNYELVTARNTKNYPLAFMKFCDKNSTLVEDPDIPCVYGIYIDIFPIDGTSDDNEEALRLKRKYEKLWNKLGAISTHNNFKDYIAILLKPHDWGRFVTKTLGFFCREWLRNFLLRKMDEISYSHPYDESKNIIIYSGSYKDRELLPKSVHQGEPIILPFENITATLSPGNETYLSRLFGDYMQLPPVEKRVTHHFFAVVDMNRRLSKQEVQARIKSHE